MFKPPLLDQYYGLSPCGFLDILLIVMCSSRNIIFVEDLRNLKFDRLSFQDGSGHEVVSFRRCAKDPEVGDFDKVVGGVWRMVPSFEDWMFGYYRARLKAFDLIPLAPRAGETLALDGESIVQADSFHPMPGEELAAALCRHKIATVMTQQHPRHRLLDISHGLADLHGQFCRVVNQSTHFADKDFERMAKEVFTAAAVARSFFERSTADYFAPEDDLAAAKRFREQLEADHAKVLCRVHGCLKWPGPGGISPDPDSKTGFYAGLLKPQRMNAIFGPRHADLYASIVRRGLALDRIEHYYLPLLAGTDLLIRLFDLIVLATFGRSGQNLPVNEIPGLLPEIRHRWARHDRAIDKVRKMFVARLAVFRRDRTRLGGWVDRSRPISAAQEMVLDLDALVADEFVSRDEPKRVYSVEEALADYLSGRKFLGAQFRALATSRVRDVLYDPATGALYVRRLPKPGRRGRPVAPAPPASAPAQSSVPPPSRASVSSTVGPINVSD